MNNVTVHNFTIGEGQPLAVFAGPCVIESLDLCREVAAKAKADCDVLGLPYVFKASFDKANRTSSGSFRGEGLTKGLEVLAAIKAEFGIPVVTDIHETCRSRRSPKWPTSCKSRRSCPGRRIYCWRRAKAGG